MPHGSCATRRSTHCMPKEPVSPRLLGRFADALQEDIVAVKAALILPWSKGPMDGQITRLQ